MDLISSLRTFARVAEIGSLSAVAREENTSPSAVTRQVAQLENHFGVRLFHRTTRHLTLTEDGQELLGQARQLIEVAEGLEGSLGRHQSNPAGHVRVGISVGGGLWFTQRLPKLFARYPELSVELVMRDYVGDMIEERLDIATVEGEVTDQSLVSRHIGVLTRLLVAAPAYLERRGAPARPDDLGEHQCIVHHQRTGAPVWRFVGAEGALAVPVTGAFSANNSEAVHRAALSGAGIARLPHAYVYDDLRTGRLLHILQDFPSESQPMHVVYPSRRHLAPRTRVVIDFLVKEMQSAFANLSRLSTVPDTRDDWLT
jgi:DNA-binding transcriptional LysR family regulator